MDIHSWDDAGHAQFQDSCPTHTRVTHHAVDVACTSAYGVSRARAGRILYNRGLWKMEGPSDLGLRQFCDWMVGHVRPVCLATQPRLFLHFKKKEESDLDHKKAWNTRSRARENLVRLMDAKEDTMMSGRIRCKEHKSSICFFVWT